MPEPVKRLLRLYVERELSVLSAARDGWTINRAGQLVSPENWCFTPGEVRSIPLLHGSIAAQRGRANAAELHLQLAKQADFIEGRYVEPGELAGENDSHRPTPVTIHHGDCSYLAPQVARRRKRR